MTRDMIMYKHTKNIYTYLPTRPAVMSSASDCELYATQLTHTDSTVWKPGRSQMTQWNPFILLTTILGERGEGKRER